MKSKLYDCHSSGAPNLMRAREDPITRFVVETPMHTETHRNPVLRFDRVAICALTIGRSDRLRKVKDSRPTFLSCSVFSQALRNFERMRLVAGNTIKPVSDVSPAIAETHQIFDKPANGVDRQ